MTTGDDDARAAPKSGGTQLNLSNGRPGSETREAGSDFIREIVRADLEAGRHSTVVTRFPPEPNGFLHIGHAKSICLNFGIASEFGGRCHLRFDDTNPTKEEQAFIDAIETDVRWLGFDWGDNLYHASDYFERLYDWAVLLIRSGKAYIDDQSQDEIRAARMSSGLWSSTYALPASISPSAQSYSRSK